eukprot:6246289-Ditylum_brightwellii.AAC.1
MFDYDEEDEQYEAVVTNELTIGSDPLSAENSDNLIWLKVRFEDCGNKEDMIKKRKRSPNGLLVGGHVWTEAIFQRIAAHRSNDKAMQKSNG